MRRIILKRRGTIIKLLIALIVILLPITIVLNSFYYYVYNTDFYENQYIENEVYNVFGKDKVDNVTKEMFGYLKNDNNITTDFFSERDKLHLIDVKDLISLAIFTYYILIIVIVFLFAILLYCSRDDIILSLGKVSLYTGSVAWVFGLLFLLFRAWFEKAFHIFHEMAFSNDYWLMNPEADNLINLFKPPFFYDITKGILTRTLAYASVLVLAGILSILIFRTKRFKIFRKKHKRQ